MTELSLRERKKIATGRELALAALDLTLERGLADTTVEDIVEHVGYSRRTFANHFTCKQEAVVDGFFLRLGMPGVRFEPPPGGEVPVPVTTDAVVDAAARAYAEVFTGDGASHVIEFGRVMHREPSLAPYVHQTVFEARRAYRERLVAAGMPPNRAVLLLGALLGVGGVVVEELLEGNAEPDDVPALLAEGLGHVRRGFAEPH